MMESDDELEKKATGLDFKVIINAMIDEIKKELNIQGELTLADLLDILKEKEASGERHFILNIIRKTWK